MNTTLLRPDAVMKNYLRDPLRFAAISNYCISPHRDVIFADTIQELDTDVAAALNSNKSINRNRDVIKEVTINGLTVIICIENQQYVDGNMSFRDLEYTYLKYKSILDSRKELCPIITLVFHHGPSRWKKGTSLFKDQAIPDEIRQFLNNWQIYVIDIKDIDASLIKNKEVHCFVRAVQELYQWDGKSKLKDYLLTIETAIAVGTITGTRAIIDQALKKQKEGMEEISMCRSVDIALANSRAEGIKKGLSDGIKQGLNEGKKEGQCILVLRQLQKKLAKELLEQTTTLVNNATLEQLDTLALSIFDIETEEDVISLLS